MNKRAGLSAAAGYLVSAMLLGNAHAQNAPPAAPQIRTLALRSGETIDVSTVYYVANCRSVMVGMPEVEILEGPPELALTIRPGMVVPRTQGCSSQVSGGTLVAAAKDVQEKKTARLVYRLKYKTKDGDRQTANTYSVELFP